MANENNKTEENPCPMFTLWTNPERVSFAHQIGVINNLPVEAWKGNTLAFERSDGIAILFAK